MPQVPDIPALSAAIKTRTMDFGNTNLPILSEFYQDGQWHIGDENTAWYLAPCFAALAATMYRYDTALTHFRDIAIETVDTAIKWNFNTPVMTTPRYTYAATTAYPNSLFGGFTSAPRLMACFDGGPWGCPDKLGDGDESATMEFGSTLTWIADMLWTAGGITDAKIKEWIQTAKYAADWLIDYNGNPLWYTNGNYVAHQCLFYTHLATLCRRLGDEDGWTRYSQAYELCMQTLIFPFGNNPPPNGQWSGYGYIVDVAGANSTLGANGHGAINRLGGTVSDGSAETGHLSETPGYTGVNPTANFDGAYSQIQMDLLATIYTINRDWRINYLLNAIWNKLATITDFSTYLIDCTGGSRQGGVRGWTGGYQNTIALLCRRISNRTQITNAMCLGAWDVQVKNNIINQGLIEVNQIVSSQARQFRICVATSLHAAHLVDKRLP